MCNEKKEELKNEENDCIINEIKNCEEYLHNKMQIDTIKDVLINHSDVPEKLVDWLIEAVERNTILITEAKYKQK